MLYNKKSLVEAINLKELALYDENFSVSKIFIDSREVEKDGLFVAIIGDNQDGHNFIKQAFDNGASCAIVQYIPKSLEDKKYNFIVVENTLEALTELAIYRRNIIKAKVIGITGSVGKTSVKEMIAFAMKNFYKIHATRENYNNHIGLPLTLINTPIDTELLILEMGMNHKGELLHLAKIARPNIAIITSIEYAHIGNFSTLQDIAEAKSEILSYNPDCVILNKDSNLFDYLFNVAKKSKQLFIVGDDPRIIDYDTTQDRIEARIFCNNSTFNFSMQCLGVHYIYNSLFIFALCVALKIDCEKAANFLKDFRVPKGRGNIEKLITNNKTITIVNDCYNANPGSMKASLLAFSKVEKGVSIKRKIAILGDMLELGSYSQEMHIDLAQYINNIDYIHTVGLEMKLLHNILPNSIKGCHFMNYHEVVKDIDNLIESGDIVLFKASNGMDLNSIINYLK